MAESCHVAKTTSISPMTFTRICLIQWTDSDLSAMRADRPSAKMFIPFWRFGSGARTGLDEIHHRVSGTVAHGSRCLREISTRTTFPRFSISPDRSGTTFRSGAVQGPCDGAHEHNPLEQLDNLGSPCMVQFDGGASYLYVSLRLRARIVSSHESSLTGKNGGTGPSGNKCDVFLQTVNSRHSRRNRRPATPLRGSRPLSGAISFRALVGGRRPRPRNPQ